MYRASEICDSHASRMLLCISKRLFFSSSSVSLSSKLSYYLCDALRPRRGNLISWFVSLGRGRQGRWKIGRKGKLCVRISLLISISSILSFSFEIVVVYPADCAVFLCFDYTCPRKFVGLMGSKNKSELSTRLLN